MSDSTKSYQRFFAELKRRHVFRVMAVYGIVGFIVLQVVDLVIPALLLPEWTYRLIALFLLVGFPVAIVLAWAFEQTPEGWKRTERAAPKEIDAIVAQPASRRWPAGLLGLLGILLLLGGWWAGWQTAPGADLAAESDAREAPAAIPDAEDENRPSIAVLPFADMSPTGDQEYFSDGITEEILNTLAKIRDLRVLGRTSAFAYKGEDKDLREIGDELGAEYLMEGSVRKSGDQLRITAQLIDAEDGSHLWSESYDRRLENIFEIQREIAEAIADELRVPLGLFGNEELVSPTADLEAYDAYLSGRARMRERGTALRDAERLFEASIARDSAWAPAWAGLAEARELLSWYPAAWDAVPTDLEGRNAVIDEYWQLAEAAARRAIALDPDNASALVALGSVHRNRRDWARAERTYESALAADPENPEAYQQYAEMLVDMGRIDAGRQLAERAATLDPAPVRLFWKMYTLLLDDRPEKAVRFATQSFGPEDETLPIGTEHIALAYLRTNRWEELSGLIDAPVSSLRELNEWLRTGFEARSDEHAGWQRFPALRAAVDVEAGRRDDAAAILLDVSRYKGRSPALLWLPTFDSLHDHPDFQAALDSLGLHGREPHRTPR